MRPEPKAVSPSWPYWNAKETAFWAAQTRFIALNQPDGQRSDEEGRSGKENGYSKGAAEDLAY